MWYNLIIEVCNFLTQNQRFIKNGEQTYMYNKRIVWGTDLIWTGILKWIVSETITFQAKWTANKFSMTSRLLQDTQFLLQTQIIELILLLWIKLNNILLFINVVECTIWRGKGMQLFNNSQSCIPAQCSKVTLATQYCENPCSCDVGCKSRYSC